MTLLLDPLEISLSDPLEISLEEFAADYFSSQLLQAQNSPNNHPFPPNKRINLIDVPFVFYKNSLYPSFYLVFSSSGACLIFAQLSLVGADTVFSPSLVSIASSGGVTLASFSSNPTSYTCLLSNSSPVNSRLLSKHLTDLNQERQNLQKDYDFIHHSLEKCADLSCVSADFHERYERSVLSKHPLPTLQPRNNHV